MFAVFDFLDVPMVEARLIAWVIGQVTLVAVATYVVVILSQRTSPAARAVVCFLGLCCMTVLPVITLARGQSWSWGQWFAVASRASQTDETFIASREPAAVVTDRDVAVEIESPAWWDAWLLASNHFFQPTDAPESIANENAARPEAQMNSNATSWLVAIVGVGMLFGLVRLLCGFWLVGRLRLKARLLDDPELEAAVDACAARLSLRPGIPIAVSGAIGTPAIVGWFRPLLLLPSHWRSWTAAERAAIFAHELAHVRRHDYLLTAIGQIAVAINYFHPLAHVLVGRMRLEQELAADAAASDSVGGLQRYVEIMAGLALRQPRVRMPGPAQAFLPPRRMFVRRLEMLRSFRIRGSQWTRSYLACALLVIVAVTWLATGFRPLDSRHAVAQERGATALVETENLHAGASLRTLILPGVIEAVVEIDMPTVLGSPAFQPVLRTLTNDLQALPLDPRSIQQLVVMLPTPGARPPMPELLLIRFSQPTELPEHSNWADRTRRLDATTFVIGGTNELRNSIGSIPSDGVLGKLLDRHAKQPIRVAAKLGWFRDTFNRESTPEGSPFRTLTPLWNDVTNASLGIDLEDQLGLTLQLDTTNPRRIMETLTALKILGRNYLASELDPNIQAADADPVQQMMRTAMIGQVTQTLDSIEIEAQEQQVLVTGSVDKGVAPLVAMLLPAVNSSRTAARRTASQNNLKQILIALHNYHDAFGHFPPAVVQDRQSGVPRSWRVELLPFLEAIQLYEQYRKDQPWDSEANLAVLKQMPAVFALPGEPSTQETPYQAIVSPGGGLTLTADGQPPTFAHFKDGTSNTVIVVETHPRVPWTKPVDVTDALAPLKASPRDSENAFSEGMADGFVLTISQSIDQGIWQALLTRDGGERIPDTLLMRDNPYGAK